MSCHWKINSCLCRILVTMILMCDLDADVQLNNSEENLSVNLLWWTPFIGIDKVVKCGQYSCFITENKKLYHVNPANINAFLFYGSNFDAADLPLRTKTQWWALLHEESPRNKPIFSHKEALSLFNFTSTFREESNAPLTTQYLKSLGEITDSREYVNVGDKNKLLRAGHAPIVYIQSDCDTPCKRDEFVQELMKYIKVDSYGACLNNKPLPEHLRDATASMQHPELRKLISGYKFALAVENAECTDYITEKLWRPISLGIVPIYWGAPNVRRWLPNFQRPAVHVRDFTSTKDLADHLHELLLNDDLYQEYLEHKINSTVGNKLLIDTVERRQWGVDNDPDKKNFIEHFECEVCVALHRCQENCRSIAGHNHYGCPEPRSVLDSLSEIKSSSKKRHFNDEIDWLEEWHRAQHEARKLKQLLETGTYKPNTYHNDILSYLIQVGHFEDFSSPIHNEL